MILSDKIRATILGYRLKLFEEGVSLLILPEKQGKLLQVVGMRHG